MDKMDLYIKIPKFYVLNQWEKIKVLMQQHKSLRGFNPFYHFIYITNQDFP